MKQITTRAIVLSRVTYGEADRIITIITPKHGKIGLVAKGVRKVKSKLAGGIELFAINEMTYIASKSGLSRLVSTRLQTEHHEILQNIDRTMYGYEVLKIVNTLTEDSVDETYFHFLATALAALADRQLPLILVKLWFDATLLRLSGMTPNLTTATIGEKLQADVRYSFVLEAMGFEPASEGNYTAETIKWLRLVFVTNTPKQLLRVVGHGDLAEQTAPLLLAMRHEHLRI